MKILVTILCFLSILSTSLGKSVTSCHGLAEYSQCSSNKECGCLQHPDASDDSGICGLISLQCSTMKPCSSHGKTCADHNHICIRHPICDFRPLCYPLNKATEEICPPSNKTLTTTSSPISSSSMKPYHPSCDWTRDGVTILNQLKGPAGLYIEESIDDDISIYVADSENHRIVKWSPEQSLTSPIRISRDVNGQLSYPHDMVIDKKDGTMFICDKGNKRIVKRMNNSNNVETFLSNVECESILMDNQGSLIASELNKHRVTKWEKTNNMYTEEKAIAGAYGQGNNLNQLDHPRDIFYNEQDQSIYISDSDNHRIVKWAKGAKEGIVVAGGNGRGNGTHQLAYPRGIALHSNGDLYIADTSNNRIVRWTPQAKSGTIIIDGTFQEQAPQPFGLMFDKNFHNLYVTDWANSRLLRFFIDGVGNCATIT